LPPLRNLPQLPPLCSAAAAVQRSRRCAAQPPPRAQRPPLTGWVAKPENDTTPMPRDRRMSGMRSGVQRAQ
jgi:hypothetical protein